MKAWSFIFTRNPTGLHYLCNLLWESSWMNHSTGLYSANRLAACVDNGFICCTEASIKGLKSLNHSEKISQVSAELDIGLLKLNCSLTSWSFIYSDYLSKFSVVCKLMNLQLFPLVAWHAESWSRGYCEWHFSWFLPG
jgi:hypothetical protein